MKEQRGGLSKVTLSMKGNHHRVLFYGFMENVCVCFSVFIQKDDLNFVAGSGKSIIWYVKFSDISIFEFRDRRERQWFAQVWISFAGVFLFRLSG